MGTFYFWHKRNLIYQFFLFKFDHGFKGEEEED